MKNSNIIGIDISMEYMLISFFHEGMREPETISLINGSQIYKIPLCAAYDAKNGKWYFGDEAAAHGTHDEGCFIDHIFERALRGESVHISDQDREAKDVLQRFLRKILGHTISFAGIPIPDQMIVTMDECKPEMIKLLSEIIELTGFAPNGVTFVDHIESFYYYALSQPRNLSIHDVLLYEELGKSLKVTRLSHAGRSIPQEIKLSSEGYSIEDSDKDTIFYDILKTTLENHIVTTVYLTGDWFDDEWMNKSLSYMGKGRRVFAGKNLFCKGACYAAHWSQHPNQWNYSYIGVNEIGVHVSLRITEKGKQRFLRLVTADSKWYESQKACEVILSGEPAFDLWIQAPEQKDATLRTLELTDFPVRQERMTRIRIEAVPKSAKEIVISVKDLGFGELCPGTLRVWNYCMQLDER